MAAESKSTAEVRFYWPPELHAQLKAIAQIDGLAGHNELAERVVAEYVRRRVHDAMVLADTARGLGIVGKVQESTGTARRLRP